MSIFSFSSASFGTLCGVNEQPVLLTNTEGTYGSFTSRVIDRAVPVSEEDPEIFFLVDTVVQTFRCFSLWQHTRIHKSCVVSRGDETVYSDCAKITLDNSVSVMKNGILGDHITWTLDTQGNLVLYGYGSMYDYTLGKSPLRTFSDVIWHVTISDGITSIGDCPFFNQNGIAENISIPDSVTSIGDYAFSECSATGFSLPDGLVTKTSHSKNGLYTLKTQ